jgi:hypothetical protein
MKQINWWLFPILGIMLFLSVHACRGVKSDSGVSNATSQPVSQPGQ